MPVMKINRDIDFDIAIDCYCSVCLSELTSHIGGEDLTIDPCVKCCDDAFGNGKIEGLSAQERRE